MNIIVKTSTGRIVVRPDTTWEKDNEDFYPPEFVDELTYSPVLFARILKPGRSVGRKFASRYYDSVGFGVLLYPENMLDGTPEGYAQAICLDHTSFLPTPIFQPQRLEEDGRFSLFRNEVELFTFDRPSLNMIEDALVEATRLLYIRTGDLIAVELSARTPLTTRNNAITNLTAPFGPDNIHLFDIIFYSTFRDQQHPEGCHDKPSALRAPSLPAYDRVPPAYSRGWLRFVVTLH